jgi:hypothetical protein
MLQVNHRRAVETSSPPIKSIFTEDVRVGSFSCWYFPKYESL